MFAKLKREYTYITSVARTFWRLRKIKRDGSRTFVDIIEEWADKTPDAPAILYEDRTVFWRGYEEGANRFADWARRAGVGRGDVVALLLDNCPEYLMAWLGFMKLGAVTALINTNLKGAALAHSITIAKPKLIVVGAELRAAFDEVKRAIDPLPPSFVLGGDLDGLLAAASPARPPSSIRGGLKAKDVAFYIYTSGTTGMPKAANVSHFRMLFMMNGFGGGLKTRSTDRTYIPLPLYHATGGVCAVGMTLTVGGCVILRKRFSAREFWSDCRNTRATLFAYIGELCRYLVNCPPDPMDGKHVLRGCTGNGLRPEVWHLFQKRFRIPRIVEFYGSTEGNVSMLNYDNVVGAVGRVPPYMKKIFPVRLVQFDIAEEKPVRGADGFCIPCRPGEIGEAIGGISDRPGRAFEGYTAAAETEKKILRNVFAKKDAWFRTGDLMRQDEDGYFYFVDRIGDTFRWKGENVATSEVAEALSVIPGIEEVNVYGVAVPGYDGRAGMAALVAAPDFDPADICDRLQLAVFARPLFLRMRPQMEITGTFKLKKNELVTQGFDPRAIDDPLYWLDPADTRYKPLTASVYEAIVAGKVKY